MVLPPDTRLGRYRILSALGAGGMGEVYLAEDTQLRRKVALKVLPPHVADDRERKLRFEQEARAASALNHPNIVTVHEIGSEGESLYIAMESIEGETLRSRMRRERLDLKTALAIATQVGAALDAAHRGGIVHRDLKPENIMIRNDGGVKVLDFGLAKLVQPFGGAGPDTETHTRLRTTPGVIMGTFAYMSPEQARGADIDARSDIFSFGVVLYEMLTGQLPFAGDTATDMIASILKTEPRPLSHLSGDISPDLERIVGRCLRKDRDERYQHVADLLIDLRDVKRELDFTSARVRSAPPPAHTTDPSRFGKRIVATAAAVVLLLSVIAGVFYFRQQRSRHATAYDAPIDSIAVLPFDNAGRDPAAEYLSDGITESLINRLSQLSKLKVMSSNAVFRYKGKTTDAQAIGRELNVRAVARGSVNRIGDRLVITVSLDDAADNHRIWGDQYVRPFADLLDVQSEIAQEVTANLRVKLTGADQQQLAKHYTEDTEAYQLYLKGQYEWKKHTPRDIEKAIGYFNEALAKDQNFALAYTGLAACYGVLGNSYVRPLDALPKAKEYATKALAIDDGLAESHLAMGALHLLYDWNVVEADKELDRALALNPNKADIHQFKAILYELTGRFDEGLREAQRAQELDPQSVSFSMEVGSKYYFARRYDEAITQLEKTIALEPHFVHTHLYLGQAYEQKGMYGKAIEIYQNALANVEHHPELVAALGHAYALSGARDKAEASLAELREMSKSQYVSPYHFAVIYVGLGETDKAFESLKEATDDRSYWVAWLKVEPQMDPLRSDPRFAKLLERIGI